jgi:hypothetical protein
MAEGRRGGIMMDFTVAVLQMNGDVTDRARQPGAGLCRAEGIRRVVRGFGLMIDENRPAAAPGAVPHFRVAVDRGLGLELDWQEPNAVTAWATFSLAGRPRVSCLMFSGYDRDLDRAATWAAEALLDDLCARWGMRRGPGLRGLRGRPLLASIPWPPSLEGTEKRLLTRYATCLAAAFFERAAAASTDGLYDN